MNLSDKIWTLGVAAERMEAVMTLLDVAVDHPDQPADSIRDLRDEVALVIDKLRIEKAMLAKWLAWEGDTEDECRPS